VFIKKDASNRALPYVGYHGYDNAIPKMHGIFMALGPGRLNFDVISVPVGLQEFNILSVAPLARWCNIYGVVS